MDPQCETCSAPRDRLHEDLCQLTRAVSSLTSGLAPVVEHVPTLVQMATVWNAAQTGGAAVGKGARWAAEAGKFITSIVGAIAIVWGVLNHKWTEILGAARP